MIDYVSKISEIKTISMFKKCKKVCYNDYL